MLSLLETGTTLGRPGNVEGVGRPAPCTGTWHLRAARGASKARQLAGPGAARPGKAPHLIHGGPCPILPGRKAFFEDRHAGNRRNAAAMTGSRLGAQARSPHGRAATGGSRRERRRVRHPACQGGADLRGPGSCTMSSALGPEPRIWLAGCVTARTGGVADRMGSRSCANASVAHVRATAVSATNFMIASPERD